MPLGLIVDCIVMTMTTQSGTSAVNTSEYVAMFERMSRMDRYAVIRDLTVALILGEAGIPKQQPCCSRRNPSTCSHHHPSPTTHQ